MSRLVATLLASAALAGCAGGPPQGRTPYQPTPDMAKVLQERMDMHAKAPEDLDIGEARDVPTVTEAAHAIPNVAGLPARTIEVKQLSDLIASGPTQKLEAFLYRPALAKDTPAIIFFSGWTWASGSPEEADETARQLAARTGWVVVSLQTRLAPEAKFPGEHDDAMALYQWARAQLRSWGADPTRVVLAGEGPGANLALSTALEARNQRVPVPDYLLLMTPWAGTSTSTPSMSENSGSRPLSRATVRWAQRLYARGNLDDPRIDLADRSDFAGMPPTTIVLADIDPLRSSGEVLGERMRAAGVATDMRLYRGVTYGFFGLGAYVPTAATAEDDVAAEMRRAFARLELPAPLSRSRARR